MVMFELLGKSRALCFSCVVSSAGCAFFNVDMKRVEQSEKKTKRKLVIKRVIIGLLIACVIVGSSLVVLNWDRIEPVFAQAPKTSSIELINSTEAVQEANLKPKSNKQKKTNKKKKKSKKRATEVPVYTYVLSTNTGKFHTEDCYYVDTIAEHNKTITQGTREELIQLGYTPCQVCKP